MSMFALSKENVVLDAGKANPKTPGPAKLASKTPFKIPLNDENGLAAHPKTGKKAIFFQDPSKFVTPIGPRRPALGQKTTNAKARQLPPPSEEGGKTKGKGRLGSGRQTKLQNTIRPGGPRAEVFQTAKSTLRDANEVPDVEYGPPRPDDLPDIPDGFEIPNYAALGQGYMTGCHRTYLAGLDEDGKTKVERDIEANIARREAELDAEADEILNERPRQPLALNTAKQNRAVGVTRSTSISKPKQRIPLRPDSRGKNTEKPTHRRGTSTTDARKTATVSSQPSYARPTSSASTRVRNTSTTTTERPTSRRGTAPSHNSIGYTAGRALKAEAKRIQQRETALEAIERILREDEERYGPLEDAVLAGPCPAFDMIIENKLEEDELQLIDDAILGAQDDDFYITMPEDI